MIKSPPHLFEFMDLNGLPTPLRNTIREILEVGNSKPFRTYYDDVVKIVDEILRQHPCKLFVELGAGNAPLTSRIAKRLAERRSEDEFAPSLIEITPCDLKPNVEQYLSLQRHHREWIELPGIRQETTLDEKITGGEEHKLAGQVTPIDFRETRHWPEGTLIVLSATFHHLTQKERRESIRAMTKSADVILIVEPLRKTVLSVLFASLSLVPALLLPVLLRARKGSARRIIWCWLAPCAPLMFLWDGWISCIRQWTENRFYEELSSVPAIKFSVHHTLFMQWALIENLRPSDSNEQDTLAEEKPAASDFNHAAL